MFPKEEMKIESKRIGGWINKGAECRDGVPFSGAIRGLQRMYEKKVYPMSVGEAVWICSDGVHIFMTKADQSIEHELLAEVFLCRRI